MGRKFTTLWGDAVSVRTQTRPGAASAVTDAESGTGDDSKRKALYALKVMLDRGLMSREDYDARRAAILSE